MNSIYIILYMDTCAHIYNTHTHTQTHTYTNICRHTNQTKQTEIANTVMLTICKIDNNKDDGIISCSLVKYN